MVQLRASDFPVPGDGLPLDLIEALLKLLMQRRDDLLPSNWPEIIPPGWRRYIPDLPGAIARQAGRAAAEAAAAAAAAARMQALDVLVGGPCLAAARIFHETGHTEAASILREFVRADGQQSRSFVFNSQFSLGFARSETTTASVARGLKIWRERPGGFRAQGGTITGLGNSFLPLAINMRLLPTPGPRVEIIGSPEAHVVGSFAYAGRLVDDNTAEWRAVNYMSLKSYFAEHWTSRLNISLIENNHRPERYGTTEQIITWRTTLTGQVVG